MGNEEFIEIAARYDRLSAHEKLWRPAGDGFDLCTTRGLKLGSVYPLGGVWVASVDGEIAALETRANAMDLVELTVKR